MYDTLGFIRGMELDYYEMKRMGEKINRLRCNYAMLDWRQEFSILLEKFGLSSTMDWRNALFITLALATQMQHQLQELEKKYPGITEEPPTVRGYAPRSQPQPQPQPQPQSPKSSTKIEQRYEKMRTGQVKPRLRSDVPTELLVSLREQGYSYNKISAMTGLSKSTIIYRLR